MTDIILSTLNARYTHSAFGLRYLYANLGEDLQPRCKIEEYTINSRPIDIAEQLLAHEPVIIGLGVYIWNIHETTSLVSLLKQIAPEVIMVLGGPEVSHETAEQEIVKLADYVVCGPGETSFRQLCEQLLQGNKPLNKIIDGIAAPLQQLAMPYQAYSDEDIAQRVVYVEASRGCPFKCEFCLSALDKTAKPFSLDSFLDEMEILYQRGLRHFKFVDRTFNLKIKNTIIILSFFLDKILNDKTELFLHFELIPDQLPTALKDIIAKFPPGALQFEIGIQTFTSEVQALISRKQDNRKTVENLHWLRQHSHAHLHTDLIFGLPGEDLDSFSASFDQLVALNPHEIQLGILKRLRGSPIIRHTDEFQLRFNPQAPYNILSTDRVDFASMQRINRFARYWDMVANSGRFKHSLPLILGDAPFKHFLAFSDQLFLATGQTHQIALIRLFRLIGSMTESLSHIAPEHLRSCLEKDFEYSGLKGKLNLDAMTESAKAPHQPSTKYNQRQNRHGS